MSQLSLQEVSNAVDNFIKENLLNGCSDEIIINYLIKMGMDPLVNSPKIKTI